MSDFFSRLALRTLAVGPVVRPDLPPVIASASEKSSAGAPILRESATATVSAGEEIAAQGLERDTELSLSAREQTILSRRTDAAFADQSQRADDRSSQALSSISPGAEHVRARASHVESDPAGLQSRDLFVRHEAPRAADIDPWDVPSVRRIVEPSRTVPSSVHVSIGRIEVRAISPAPRASASERRPPNRLSLEQYLRERNEGRR